MEVRARLDQLQRQIEQFAPPAQPTDRRELPPFVSHQIVQLQKQLQQIRDQVQSMARPSMTEGPLQPIFQSGQTLEPLRK